MKKLFFFCAAVLLLGMQQASAWSFRADSWGGVDNAFTGVGSFYTDGYNATTGLDIYLVTFDAPQGDFKVYRYNDGTDQQMYASNFSPALGNGSVVRDRKSVV